RDAHQLAEGSVPRGQGAPTNGMEGRRSAAVGEHARRRVRRLDPAAGGLLRHIRSGAGAGGLRPRPDGNARRTPRVSGLGALARRSSLVGERTRIEPPPNVHVLVRRFGAGVGGRTDDPYGYRLLTAPGDGRARDLSPVRAPPSPERWGCPVLAAPANFRSEA